MTKKTGNPNDDSITQEQVNQAHVDENNQDHPAEDLAKETHDQATNDAGDILAKYAAKERQCEELAAQFTRLRADFDNYKRRTRAEVEDITTRASEKLITRLLPVIDNLDRACTAAKTATDGDSITSGVELVRRGLLELLASEGLEELPGEGTPFDPNMHEAVDRVSDSDDASYVVAVYQKGYRLSGRVLRAAMVKVGPKPVADTVEQ